jgi:8-oxo-dGTP pyrophosphatase MutT (NUDIX family)
VLVPLFEHDGETKVWFVRRPTSMRSHAGQVAFPGGKSDPDDASTRETALREAYEELGIEPATVDVLGALDDVRTTTGFMISPWLGWCARGIQIRPNPDEVDRAFAVSLRTFLTPPSGMLPWRGWTVEGELVWGATGQILQELVAILRALGVAQ